MFIVGGRLSKYIKKSKGPRIDSCGTPYFTFPHFEEIFSKDFNSAFCFLFVR
jgi:hypothetical protein